MKVMRPDSYSSDCKETLRALDCLDQVGLRYDRPTQWQIKIRGTSLSYYPRKGTIFRDGTAKALPERGLEALASQLGLPEPCLTAPSSPTLEQTLSIKLSQA